MKEQQKYYWSGEGVFVADWIEKDPDKKKPDKKRKEKVVFDGLIPAPAIKQMDQERLENLLESGKIATRSRGELNAIVAENAKKKIDSIEKDREALKEQFERKFHDQDKKINDLNKRLSRKTEEFKEARRALKPLENEIDKLKKALEKAEADRQKAIDDLNDANSEFKELFEENQALKKAFGKLQKERDDLQAALSDFAEVRAGDKQ